MPFQSEAQRRYLWANEPEIARDWADTYGSRIESNTGGITRLGFANSNKEYLDFKKWFDAQQQQGQEESIHELYQQYQRDKRDKKVYDQKHMAATGGIMRLGYAQGNPHTDTSSTSYGPPGSPSRASAPAYQPTSNLGVMGNVGGGNVGGPEVKTRPSILGGLRNILPWLGKKGNVIGGALSIYDLMKQRPKDEDLILLADETDETEDQEVQSPTLGSHLLVPKATARQNEKDAAMAALYKAEGWTK